ncbi:hypothetical protein SAMN05421857_4077 [Chryseobacterium formosense]|uniref:nucleotide kinase domain-containing protein n=1 Tax=Chryseobacterium formosense TaxID=236814 RepID=UPI000691A2D8|nr:nucleotide kinase domain-containing protein [Chryseobacterium formosense]SFT91224.1 hypothetical protein SAMN05421857_4077 [Chryseobacterium formosense]
MIHYTALNKPKKSIVYDKYWIFAAKRFEVFINRLNNPRGPWTSDNVICNHRFTNVFRASDRVSQYLIGLQYDGGDYQEIFFKTILFKIFNKIETYQCLEEKIGSIDINSFKFKDYDLILKEELQRKTAIYSAAYIMPSAGSAFGHTLKHTNHLALIQKMIDDNLFQKVMGCNSLSQVYELLLRYPSIGNFLAFQYTIDLNYSTLINFSEMDFVVAGPGAKNGIKKCFSSLGDYSFEDVIKMMAENQSEEFDRLQIEHPNLWGRELQLIDCQNLFCEVDKYLRVTNPEVIGVTDRKRIKQKFSMAKPQYKLFFPPKWNINEKIDLKWQHNQTEDIFS